MIARDNLSQVIAREERDRIVSGALAAGRRINEVHLARELAVSRTRLREALPRPAVEDFVEVNPRQGFAVPPLSVTEVQELYPIRAVLDPWALRLAGAPGKDRLRELEALNRDLAARADDAAAGIALDDRFHMAVVASCPNQQLLALIPQQQVTGISSSKSLFADRYFGESDFMIINPLDALLTIFGEKLLEQNV